MESENKRLKVLVVILLIMLLGLCGLYYYVTFVKTDKVANNEEGEVNTNKDDDESNILSVDEYISISDFDINSQKDSVKIVEFKNLNDSLVTGFNEKQEEFIKILKNNMDSYHSTSSEEIDDVLSSTVWGQINNDVLTVYEKYTIKWEMDTDYINIINIDLKNKTILSDENVLELADYNFSKLANKYYEEALNKCNDESCFFRKSDSSECRQDDKVGKQELINQKEYYISLIKNGLDDAIYVYIKDEKVHYAYYSISIIYIYQNICKGGPFPLIDIELD